MTNAPDHKANGSAPILPALVTLTASAPEAVAMRAGPELERLMRVIMPGFRLMDTVGSTEAMGAALEVERLLARMDAERRAQVQAEEARMAAERRAQPQTEEA